MTEICKDCKHYYETTDYCDLILFEADEKFMETDIEEIEECLYYEPIGSCLVSNKK